MTEHKLLSVVIPVLGGSVDLAITHNVYRESLEGRGWMLQFVYVVDGDNSKALDQLRNLKASGADLQILHLPHRHGGATALSIGFRYANGERIMTLPDIPQVSGEPLARLLEASHDHDLTVARRIRLENEGKEGKFEAVVRMLLGSEFKDLRSPVRVLNKCVADEVSLYGEQQNFLSLIAQSHGFSVQEVDTRVEAPSSGVAKHFRRKPNLILDVVNAFFLIKFVRKPFRFFGGFGLSVLALGLLFTSYLVASRLFFDVPLLDRPALILSSLMVVLGIQILSVGLIGEIITFAFTKDHRDYKVERVVD